MQRMDECKQGAGGLDRLGLSVNADWDQNQPTAQDLLFSIHAKGSDREAKADRTEGNVRSVYTSNEASGSGL